MKRASYIFKGFFKRKFLDVWKKKKKPKKAPNWGEPETPKTLVGTKV